MTIDIRQAISSDWDAVRNLLTANQLPVDDIDTKLQHFFVAVADGMLAGAIGMEQYEQFGLLRSMVTNEQYRNHGIASKLVNTLFSYAAAKGITEIYLLTETAKDYFLKREFTVTERSTVPPVVQKSAEFSHVCPLNATVMKQVLTQ